MDTSVNSFIDVKSYGMECARSVSPYESAKFIVRYLVHTHVSCSNFSFDTGFLLCQGLHLQARTCYLFPRNASVDPKPSSVVLYAQVST